MKTSLNEIVSIERYLLSNSDTTENVLMQARLILQSELQESMHWQQKTYELIDTYGREKLRKEINEIQKQLFNDPKHSNFREKILRLFSK